jgi:hypothetical protein
MLIQEQLFLEGSELCLELFELVSHAHCIDKRPCRRKCVSNQGQIGAIQVHLFGVLIGDSMLVEFAVPHGVAFDGMILILMWLWGSLHFVPRILCFLGITSFGRSSALLFQHSGEFHHAQHAAKGGDVH